MIDLGRNTNFLSSLVVFSLTEESVLADLGRTKMIGEEEEIESRMVQRM